MAIGRSAERALPCRRGQASMRRVLRRTARPPPERQLRAHTTASKLELLPEMAVGYALLTQGQDTAAIFL
jgi:hypothetical protein